MTIIGIIASLTIPDLIQNITDQQNKIAYKKVYSELSQASLSIMEDHGGTLKGIWTSGLWTDMRDAYKTKLMAIKSCDSGALRGSCWSPVFYGLDNSIITYISVVKFDGYSEAGHTNPPGIILSSGTFVAFEPDFDCVAFTEENCGSIYVDVNGFKNPNKMGKDIFAIHVTPMGLKPFGYQGASGNMTLCDTAHNGYACSLLYLIQ